MAIQIRATAFNSSSSNVTTAGLTIPASTQPGDLILELIESSANALVQTPPAGWTALSTLTVSNSSGSLRGARRIAQIGDANTAVTFTLNTSSRWAAVLVVLYDDLGATARIEQLAQVTTSNTTSPQAPAIDPQNTNDLLLSVVSGTSATAAAQPVYTAGGSTTMQVQTTGTSLTLRNASIAVASLALPDANLVNAITHTSSQTIASLNASILISNQNVGPVANAGPDQAVNPGATVTLDGTGSTDFDGNIAGYLWTQTSGTAVTLSNNTAAQPTFTAPVSVNGATLIFSLVVTDDGGASSSPDNVTIIVGATPNEQVWIGGTMQKKPLKHWVGSTWVG